MIFFPKILLILCKYSFNRIHIHFNCYLEQYLILKNNLNNTFFPKDKIHLHISSINFEKSNCNMNYLMNTPCKNFNHHRRNLKGFLLNKTLAIYLLLDFETLLHKEILVYINKFLFGYFPHS